MAEVMKNLVDQCLLLPKKRKQHLIQILTESLAEKDRPYPKERFDLLYRAASDVCGQGILGEKRSINLVIGRRLIAYKMREEGCPLEVIGKYLLRHHASVAYMLNMLQEAFDMHFHYDLALWDLFNKKVEEYEKEISGEVV